jgi:hypothetical protein
MAARMSWAGVGTSLVRFGVFGPALGALLVLPFALVPAVWHAFRQASLAPLADGLAASFMVGVGAVFVGVVPGLATGLLLGPFWSRLPGRGGVPAAALLGGATTWAWVTAMPIADLVPWKMAAVGAVAAALVAMTAEPERGYRPGGARSGDSP